MGLCCSGSGKALLPWKTVLYQALIPTVVTEARAFLFYYFCYSGHGMLACKQISLGNVSLTRLDGEPGSDGFLQTISIWLSQQPQHKSDLLSVTNDLSPEGLSHIFNNSKQHLSKSFCITGEPTAIVLLLPNILSVITPNIHTHMHTHTINILTCAFLALLVDVDES